MEQGVFLDQPAEKKGTHSMSVGANVAVLDASLNDVIDAGVDSAILQAPVVSYSLPSLQFQISKTQEFSIRALDIVGSVILLVLSLPAMLFTAMLIKIFSPGHIFFKQERVGKNGKLFTLHKFRTMINNAEQHTGPILAAKDDSRVTPIGKFLRATRLDELPQLFDVLKGDMSLVGPRPERPFFIRRHRVLQGVRLFVKPGLTGLAQVRGYYDLKPEHKIKYDYLYIQNRSLLLNIYILLQTIPVIFLKKGW